MSTLADSTIDLDTAYALLRSTAVGRLAWIADDRPEILPITFALVGGAIVLRTGLGAKERAAAARSVAAFEADGVDTEAGVAWSVVVHGRLEDVADPAEIAALEDALPPTHVAGERHHVVRLNPRAVRGRRFPLAPAWRA